MTLLGLVWSGLGVCGRPHVVLCRALDHVGRATFHVASRVILDAQFYNGQSVRRTRFHRQIVSSTLRCFIGRSFLRHLFHRCVIRRSFLRHSMLDRAYYSATILLHFVDTFFVRFVLLVRLTTFLFLSLSSTRRWLLDVMRSSRVRSALRCPLRTGRRWRKRKCSSLFVRMQCSVLCVVLAVRLRRLRCWSGACGAAAFCTRMAVWPRARPV